MPFLLSLPRPGKCQASLDRIHSALANPVSSASGHRCQSWLVPNKTWDQWQHPWHLTGKCLKGSTLWPLSLLLVTIILQSHLHMAICGNFSVPGIARGSQEEFKCASGWTSTPYQPLHKRNITSEKVHMQPSCLIFQFPSDLRADLVLWRSGSVYQYAIRLKIVTADLRSVLSLFKLNFRTLESVSYTGYELWSNSTLLLFSSSTKGRGEKSRQNKVDFGSCKQIRHF